MKNKISALVLILVFLLLHQFTYSQNQIVKRIEFIGNEKTKQYILNREIQHRVNIPLDSALAEEDRIRLENLGIFSLVNLQYLSNDNNEVVLRYVLIENWRYFPMLTPIYDEKWGWSAGAMLMISNFRGRNETLSISGQVGGQNTFEFEFNNPWITGDHVSLNFGAGNNIYNHTFLQFDVKNKYLHTNVGKYLNKRFRVKTGFSYYVSNYSNDLDDFNYSHFIPFFKFTYDSRDIYAYPSRGFYINNTLSSNLDTKGTRNNRLNWEHSSSYYKEISNSKLNTVLGINISNKLSFGKKLDIWQNYIGGAYTVRGWVVPNSNIYTSGNRDYRFGHNWVTSSLEIRQTIVPKFVTSLWNELGLHAVAFTDFGYTSMEWKTLFKYKPLMGMGIGIRIPWSVIGSIRLDYGWSFYNGKYVERALHLAFGEKF